MQIIIAQIHRDAPTDAELTKLHRKYGLRHNQLAAQDQDTFDVDCTLFDIENEMTARGIAFAAFTR